MHLILVEPLGMHLEDGDLRLCMLPVALNGRYKYLIQRGPQA